MDLIETNAVDIGIVAVLLLSGLLALFRGFVRELLSVATWLGAIAITLYGFNRLEPFIAGMIGNETVTDIVTVLALFIVSLVLLTLLSHAVASGVHSVGLRPLDRSLGFLFGVLRGAVIVAVAYMALSWQVPPADQPPWLRGARTLPAVEWGADLLRRLVPEAARKGEAATKEAERRIKLGIEADKLLRRFSTPQPKGAASGAQSGYKKEDLRDMRRLMESLSQPGESPSDAGSRQP